MSILGLLQCHNNATRRLQEQQLIFCLGTLQPKEPTPEERAKAVRKQSIEVKETWEQLKTHASNWQKQVEKALEKLQELQKALDDLEAHVITAEGIHTDWQPVGDLFIDSLQDHIDKTTVTAITLHFTYEHVTTMLYRDDQ
ncbi:utrophin-like isoform X1 [Stegostoma tigrinum]|uniref:utrophin-like isoform X1 n=1 Tax=Stegostoma tigrinum TaxID=3053191 RepID=UPI0028704DB5|nr:utrophin-like isoform X1 [Stegostoma tigrinum]